MSRIYIFFISLTSLYVIKPFINAWGCDFAFHQNNEVLKLKSMCRNGIVVSDVYDKRNQSRLIRKSLYGYWDGISYNIPIYSKEINYSNAEFDVDPFFSHEVLQLWTLSSFKNSNENVIYSLLDSKEGYMFNYSYDKTPKRGVIDSNF
ncbi:hypothetical protein NPV54_002578 [Vibrio cholerae]|nr:hypothetical protein [Vibrio cholerae]EJL6949366.1 hypothetical protein [Vibrio cholerae]EJN3163216.1 hypothetical protein [Vibrio cholerae]